jgi:hypothetical protein
MKRRREEGFFSYNGSQLIVGNIRKKVIVSSYYGLKQFPLLVLNAGAPLLQYVNKN